MKHRRWIAPILLAISLAFTALPALDGHAQGVPADPGLPGPYAAEQLAAYPVSTAVNKVANNSPDLVLPLPEPVGE
mgnify:CR=1 FL=1